MRSGPRDVPRTEMAAMLERCGTRLSATTSWSYVQFHATCLERHLDESMAFLSRMLRKPAYRGKDLAFHKRDTMASRFAARDDYKALAARAFTIALYGAHPYGQSLSGTRDSLSRIRIADVKNHVGASLCASNMALGFAGAVDTARAEQIVSRHWSWLPERKVTADTTPPVPNPKRVAHVVEIEGIPQVHTYLGTLGARVGEADYEAWFVSSLIFGGTFSSRLIQEIREKHGYSYDVSARLGSARRRSSWRMYSFPSATDFAACLKLELDMIAQWVDKGVSAKELREMKKHLALNACFEKETASKRLEPRLDSEIYDLPEDWYPRELDRIHAVRRRDVLEVLKRRVKPSRLVLGVVGPPGTAETVEKVFKPKSITFHTPVSLTS